MLIRHTYYSLKPVIPLRLRMALRRLHARRLRRRSTAVWPIHSSAAKIPEGWPGWPDDKQFALVLTHDVEGKRGLDRCRRLAEFEMRLGFLSSFNFVPEGEYDIPKELREFLSSNGFEVGVHDLRHDGKLYRSRRVFQANAERINRYLKEWNAVGFRSGFMLREMDWLHDLSIAYDASTFDTDPFEPQPDGAHTIFPFWVPAPRPQFSTQHSDLRIPHSAPGAQPSTPNPQPSFQRGYVELPYTLPQDSTLFLLFREKSIDIWKQKLDWVAEHGGMVLLVTHPDCMAFRGAIPHWNEYSSVLYEEFLEWLKQKYAGKYWQVLPKAVAAFYRHGTSLDSRQALAESLPWGDGQEQESRFRPRKRGGGMRVATIVGARPQFIKAAAVSRELRKRHKELLVHTGQHYDYKMSGIFFDGLDLPSPDVNLDVGSGSHGAQTGTMLGKIEEVLLSARPDWVLVYGDTNSTLAGALAASKLHIPVAHVEAGLRSFNRRMPEEINRVIADHLSDLLLCPSQTALTNLAGEGIVKNVHLVGDVMLDALTWAKQRAHAGPREVLQRLGLKERGYLLATVHRSENTDDPKRLTGILNAFSALDEIVVFPVHPRARKIMEADGYRVRENVRLIEPLGYSDMVTLTSSARLVLTDSGGLQKEAYWLGVPCVTLRDETEWVETVEAGWNVVVGSDCSRIVNTVQSFKAPASRKALYGDGCVAARCVDLLG